jgi:N-acetylmuramoyl-L-alanine amidase
VIALSVAVVAAVSSQVATQAPQSARAAYERALALETELRRDLELLSPEDESAPVLRRVATTIEAYRQVVRRYPRSGYSDNALWQAGVLSTDSYVRFGRPEQRATALQLFDMLSDEYPSSSLVPQVPKQTGRLTTAASQPAVSPQRPSSGRPAVPPVTRGRGSILRAIRRESLEDALRVTLELEREAAFHAERLDSPPRVFIDLSDTSVVAALRNVALPFSDDVVRQIRVGRQPDSRTRVVLDLQGAARHSVYPLYDPYRLVIDVERAASAPAQAGPPPAAPYVAPNLPAAGAAPAVMTAASSSTPPAVVPPELVLPASRPAWPAPNPGTSVTAGPAPPLVASSNISGGFSLSRQLGLGVARIVIDPGHGGHDPGAQVTGLNEADLVLDVALRLEGLLQERSDVDVILTRRTNVYISLEERTTIANRFGADLFLSIHANASRNAAARGVETYFLNFAANPDAEAVAARENAGSSKTMSSLPELVRAIALNNKLDESRDFAAIVQSSMYENLRKVNQQTKNLGVKQAPFMVLVGATMPSVLAEISFMTNRQEAALLRSQKYRQHVAEALLSGVLRYQGSLRASRQVVASGTGNR